MGCVGQQNVGGERIPFGFKARTLPYFHDNDYELESRGFILNSYVAGLSPPEFFFHAMAGREGLINTNVVTRETGYIQRRLVRALDDIGVSYDGTVRNSAGQIIQFVYGEDGFDATRLEHQELDYVLLSTSQFNDMYRYDVDRHDFGDGYLAPEVISSIKNSIVNRDLLTVEYEQLKQDRKLLRTDIFFDGKSESLLPCHMKRLINLTQHCFSINIHSPQVSLLHPVKVIEAINLLLSRLHIVGISSEWPTHSAALTLFKIHLRSTLASKRVLKEYRLSPEAFDWMIAEIETQYNRALVQPGEMVGALAA